MIASSPAAPPLWLSLGWGIAVIVLFHHPARTLARRRVIELKDKPQRRSISQRKDVWRDLPSDRGTAAGHRAGRRWWATAGVGLAVGWFAAGTLGVAVAGGCVVWRLRRRRTRSRIIRRELCERAMIEVFDVASLSTEAGLPLSAAIEASRQQVTGAALVLVDEVSHGTSRGLSVADALRRAVDGSPPSVLRAIDDVLTSHRSGTPVSAALRRGSAQLKESGAARRAERARRLPVSLLGPLIVCILPAVCLMVVVPMLVRLVTPI